MIVGAGGVWAQIPGQQFARAFEGTPGGINEAMAYCGNDGVVMCGPGITLADLPGAINPGVIFHLTVEGRPITVGAGTVIGTGNLREPVFNAKDFYNLQACHDAMPTQYGMMYIPAGYYFGSTWPHVGTGISPALEPALRVTKSITIFGDGPGRTFLKYSSVDAHKFNLLQIETSGVVIRDMTLIGTGSPGRGNLIEWFKSGSSLGGLTVDNVEFYDAPAWGFKTWGDVDGVFTGAMEFSRLLFGSTTTAHGGARGGTSATVSGCNASNSRTITSANNFITAGVGPGDLINSAGHYGTVRTVSANSITINENITLSNATLTFTSGSGDMMFGGGRNIGVNNAVFEDCKFKGCDAAPPMFASGYRMGALHMNQMARATFGSCNYQGHNLGPVCSFDVNCHQIVFRDFYREPIHVSTGSDQQGWGFVVGPRAVVNGSGYAGGIYEEWGHAGPTLLKVDAAALFAGFYLRDLEMVHRSGGGAGATSTIRVGTTVAGTVAGGTTFTRTSGNNFTDGIMPGDLITGGTAPANTRVVSLTSGTLVASATITGSTSLTFKHMTDIDLGSDNHSMVIDNMTIIDHNTGEFSNLKFRTLRPRIHMVSGVWGHQTSSPNGWIGAKLPSTTESAIPVEERFRGMMIWDDAAALLKVWDGTTWRTF